MKRPRAEVTMLTAPRHPTDGTRSPRVHHKIPPRSRSQQQHQPGDLPGNAAPAPRTTSCARSHLPPFRTLGAGRERARPIDRHPPRADHAVHARRRRVALIAAVE
eukprot:3331759-Prymnesium_polylepis.1